MAPFTSRAGNHIVVGGGEYQIKDFSPHPHPNHHTHEQRNEMAWVKFRQREVICIYSLIYLEWEESLWYTYT